MNGFITLDKKITEWEWYRSVNERTVFIHLLITCNYENKKWRNYEVNRGQIITSYSKLSQQTGLSVQSIRSALANMQKTGELTCKSTNRFTLVTICKYDDYQIKKYKGNKPDNTESGNPNSKQTNTPGNDDIKKRKNKKESIPTPPFNGLGVDARTWCEGVMYFSSKEDPGQKMAKKIYSHYKKAGFLYKGKPIDRRNYDEAIQSYLNSQNS